MDGPTLSIEPLNKPTGNASTLYNSTIQLETNGIINRSINEIELLDRRWLRLSFVFYLLQMFCGCLHFQQIYPPHNLICKAPVSLQQYIFRCKTVDGIQNPEIYKLNISYTDKAKTWNVKVANWYFYSNMVFQNANCLNMTVLIFYNPVLVKEAGLILSNGETPPLVQNKTNPQLVFQPWPGQGLNKELA